MGVGHGGTYWVRSTWCAGTRAVSRVPGAPEQWVLRAWYCRSRFECAAATVVGARTVLCRSKLSSRLTVSPYLHVRLRLYASALSSHPSDFRRESRCRSRKADEESSVQMFLSVSGDGSLAARTRGHVYLGTEYLCSHVGAQCRRVLTCTGTPYVGTPNYVHASSRYLYQGTT